jgi:hypothetical protein
MQATENAGGFAILKRGLFSAFHFETQKEKIANRQASI